MKKSLQIILFIFVESLMLIIIVFLVIKIKNLYSGNVKGIQYVTDISKDIVFDKENQNLKYFYEPKPNTIETDKPKWLNKEVKYFINSDSLNEEDNYLLEKPYNTYRIITIGDSFTFGMYVNTSDNYPEALEKKLNNKIRCNPIRHFEVINLGVSGYDIDYVVSRFNKRGIKYDPDLVIWLLINNDFMRINDLIFTIEEELKQKGLKDIISKDKLFTVSYESYKELQKRYGYQQILSYQTNSIFKLASIYNGKLLIVSFPSLKKDYKKIIHQFIGLNNNYFYLELFDITSDDKYQLLDTHPNESGYDRISDDLIKLLLQQYLPDCK